MRLGTFTADIIVNGRALEQYDVVFESPTKATCWIASEEGKSFSVKWVCHEESRLTGIQGRVRVDGIRCGHTSIEPGRLGVESTVVFSHFICDTTKRKLIFARVQLSDDDSLLDKEIPKNLGEICLIIERGKLVKEHCVVSKDLPVFSNNTYHERSKKATVHCIGLGSAVARIPPSYRRRLILSNDPILTFVFKYRPLSVLQADGIAPRPASNDARAGHEINSCGSNVRITNPTSEDIKPTQLNGRIQTLENELKRLRELQGTNFEDQKPKRVKREERRQPLFAPGEIIDLT